ncbi:MAG: hypothetical protein KDA93_25015 [Planctomycetaceae bacterium]|nr:hypothetical protein [Planctomycetaceae bacterium]
MDAKALAATALLVAVCPAIAVSATYKTPNFVVTADSQQFAEQVGKAAEIYRHELAISWLGEPLPGNWGQPCPITCKTGRIGAGGATTFTFNNGEVFGWKMDIQGSEERILDSVLPHEVSHMIFACHFRCPLPRWADEGAATLVEHESERMRQTRLLNQVIKTSKRIPLSQLLSIKEYPRDMQDVLTLYAEGYSLADYLVQQKGEEGRAVFLAFLGDALHGGWERAFKKHYDISDVSLIEKDWTGWVMAGSPNIKPADKTLVAANDTKADPRREPEETTFRGQSTQQGYSPLPKLARQPRLERTSVAELTAPQPRSMSVATAETPQLTEVPQEPVSVHPARPTTDPPKSKWQFPWSKDSEETTSPPQSGFTNPKATAGSFFDFSR